MSDNFQKVKDYIAQLGCSIVSEDTAEELVVIDDEENGIKNLIIDCEDPILILEQIIMEVPSSNTEVFFKRLLQLNRTLVHGAFALDEDAATIIFRDTLQLANLDLNEIEGSIRALSLALAENADELLCFSKG